MHQIGSYHIRPFTKFRRNIALIVHEGWKKHATHEIMELDVTNGKHQIKTYKQNTGTYLSFTGWIIKCAAQALSEHKEINAYRRGRKIYYFDDVDVPIPIERTIQGEEVPQVYILRKVTKKSLEDISSEIKNATSKTPDEKKQLIGETYTWLERFAFATPASLQKLLIKMVRNRPLLKKKYMGTLAVTAVGMKGKVPGWMIPLGGTTTIMIVVGGIMKKPRVIDDDIVIRDILHVTLTVDHDIIDGGPLARFTDRFIDLVEQGYAIPGTHH